MKTQIDPIKGQTIPVFLYYSIPSVLSMMAISCAVIIDGIFIGNHSGATALASVNLTLPVNALLIGLALMMSVGGAARCGRALGRGDMALAHRIFSQTLTLTIIMGLAATVLGLIFKDGLAGLLGTNPVTSGPTLEYLGGVVLFFSCQMGIVCLSCFLRTDGYPMFAAAVMVAGSFLNILLDWLFIMIMDMGLTGAAIGTGLSELITVAVLALPFIRRRTRLRFVWRYPDPVGALKSACNGFSEFSNEVAGGLITLVFNWVLMQRMGETGVAAFSVINYIILCGIIINCGISDSIQPVVSKNFGAGKPGRISDFLCISTLSAFAIGTILSGVLFFFPESFINLFIETGDHATTALTSVFISCIWPVFLLNGINIVVTSYLLSMKLAFYSTLVSLARTLFLPAFFLLTLPSVTGDKGIMLALPVSEAVTFLIVVFLVRNNRPSRLIPSGGFGKALGR